MALHNEIEFEKSLQAPRQPTVEGHGKIPMASPLPQPIWEGCTDEQSP